MQAGAAHGALAFVWWGLFPLCFRIVTSAAPFEVPAHRAVWCTLFLALVRVWRRQCRPSRCPPEATRLLLERP